MYLYEKNIHHSSVKNINHVLLLIYLLSIWPKNREWLVTRVKTKKKELKATRGANKIRKSKVSRILLTLRITLDEPSLDT